MRLRAPTPRRPGARRGRRLAAILGGCAALLLCPPAPLHAQDNPVIRAAAQLAAEGHGDSARGLVARELARARPGDAAYVEALFWRGRLAVLGDSAERDFRRVALDHPTSAWADDALLALAQVALAAGNPAAALELAGRLRDDYPGSALAPRAALWGARASFEVGEPRGACALLDSARVEAAADVEFRNQVVFFQQRCTPSVLAIPRPDTVTRTPPPARATPDSLAVGPPAPTTRPLFMVQVFAAHAAAEAADVVRRLAWADLSARVVAGDGFHRVRMGPYASEREARDAAAAARRAVGGTPFIVRVP